MSEADYLRRLDGLPPSEQHRTLLGAVRRATAAVLDDPAVPVAPGQNFTELGFDSLLAVRLHALLVAETGLELPVTLVYDHPTPDALASFLRAELLGLHDAPPPERVGSATDDPVVVVGVGCRFPGGIDSPERLWEVVDGGLDVISGFPGDRGWDVDGIYDPRPGTPGKTYVREGGFLHDAAWFDAGFFGISPREALTMDPQQRLVLETSWEALERAGIDPTGLRGSTTGVFLGAEPQEYGPKLADAPEGLDGHLLTGTAPSVISGRVAYALGLQGPVFTVDTACSGSLVALHLAARALRSGDCSLALAGGVAVLGTPGAFVAFSSQRGLAPDGRCKAFSDDADGTAWAEGAGVFVLERLSDARRNGHPVLAVLRGSAINSDGASNGLTAPNGPSQQRVIRAALADAGLRPSDVDAVEAHGTGTRLGDPIEAQAILAAYGRDRAEPLRLGSIKSNIGHAQAAAGAAGVIKVIMAMRHDRLPRTLHVGQPATAVDWSAGAVELLTEPVPWPRRDAPRRAGVSSFGISGTNAHVIVEEPEPVEADAPGPVPVPPLIPFAFSAADEPALLAQAERLHDFLDTDPDPADLAFTLAGHRAALPERAVALAADRAGLATALADFRVVRGTASAAPVAFLFTGQGAQRLGMGVELYDAFDAYADAFDEVCAHVDLQLATPLRDVVLGDDAALLDRTEYAQPALFAVEVALYRLLEHWGLRPDYLCGHSIGEFAAAHVAGVLDLADAAMLVTARGRLMQALPPGGAMVSLRTSEEHARSLVAGYDDLGVAAVNGPDAVVLSGAATSLDRVLADFTGKAKRLTVSHAFHSPLMRGALAEFGRIARLADHHPARLPIVSTVTGRIGGHDDPDYWVRHVEATVRFADAARTLADAGVGTYLELGPDAVLSALVGDAPAGDGTGAVARPLLRRDRPEVPELLTAVATAHVRGADVDLTALVPGGRRVDLPTYPFRREHHWLAARPAADAVGLGLRGAGHPLLGAVVAVAGGDTVFTASLSTADQPWLAGHTVLGDVLLPGTAFLELALHAGGETGAPCVEELTLGAPLVLSGPVELQVVVGAPDEDDRRPVSVHSRPRGDDGPWTRHATGTLAREVTADAAPVTWPPTGRAHPLEGFYDDLVAGGFDYTGSFRGLRAAWVDGDDVYAEVALPEGEADGFGIHPALLDAALHAMFLRETDESRGGLPFSWNGVRLSATGATSLRLRVSFRSGDTVSLLAVDPTGAPVVVVDALVVRPPEAVRPATALPPGLLAVRWTPAATRDEPLPPHTVLEVAPAGDVLAATHEVTARVLRALQDRDESTTLVVRTRGAVVAGDGDPVDPAAAAVWGLVRSAQSEHPDRFVLVDGDADAVPVALATGEPQVAVRDGVPLVPRAAHPADRVLPPPPGNWRLDKTGGDTVDDLALVPVAHEPLGPNGVRVSVRAAGLNFRDVLNALGMYPGEAGPLGCEVAGVVTEVGDAVVDLVPGDEVMGVAHGAIGPEAVADRPMITRKPGGWSFEQAATVPLVFLTAYYALCDLGGLKAGESILIHSAAGGVGMAATQLARHLGAEVYGTASEGKRHVLRAAGLDDGHIASSRTLEFADRFAGIDVVLNALAGEFVDASLRTMAPGGRFLEMGKTDVREDVPGVAYQAFDLIEAGPRRTAEMWEALVGLFNNGALEPLPVRAWDVREAREAFRFVSQARHIGKVALTVPAPLDPDKTVLVTGGTGGLGALVARHLIVNHGVRKLLLTSRRGLDAPGADELRRELVELGAQVEVAACDVSDRAAVAALLDGVALTGVVHAAGVLDDGVLDSLTPERLAGVLRPKADAAWHLHELTEGHDLALFVLYSSVSGVVGGAGQGSYAAANAFLDALAEHRRARGLPGQSLAWGLWREGMGSGLAEADVDRMSREGLPPLTAADGLALFDAALACGLPTVLPVELDRVALREHARTAPLPAVLRSLVAAPARRAARGEAAEVGLTERLAPLPDHERTELVRDLVRHHAAAALGHGGDTAIDAGRAFKDLGFDSLTSVELRNRVNAATGLRLSSTAVFDHPTVAALAEHVLTELAPPVVSPADAVLAELDRLERGLAAVNGGDDGGRAAVAGRLRALLDQVTAVDAVEAAADRLEAATADELVDFLATELGIS
ncbi:SDR family NAD(P)-dependent oxidoreductase [Saccharothrix sp. DSM 118769]